MYTNAHLFGINWNVKYLTGVVIPSTPQGMYPPPEGQFAVVASIIAGSGLDYRRAEAIVYQLLHSQAQIFSISVQSSFQSGTYRSTVEYCDVTASHAAATRFTDAVIEVCFDTPLSQQFSEYRLQGHSAEGKYASE